MNARIILPILFAGLTLASACKKDDDDDDNITPTEITINSYPQFAGTVDGTAVEYVSTDGHSIGFGVDQSIDTVINQTDAIYYSGLNQMGNDSTLLVQIRMGTLTFPNGSLTESQFVAFFATGNYSYTDGADDGIEINYTDENGINWSTSNGSQSGSAFTIKEKQVDEDLQGAGFYSVKILAELNFKLYDDDGNSKTITDATYVGYFVKY